MSIGGAIRCLRSVVWHFTLGRAHAAAWFGDAGKMKRLIGCNPDVVCRRDSRGYTPLHVAVEGMSSCRAKELAACRYASIEAFNQLVDGVESELTERYLAVMRLLVEAGADVDARDDWGYTPLHIVAMTDNAEAAVFLLESGSDVNARTAFTPRTPLSMCEESEVASQTLERLGRKSVAKVLREWGGEK